MILIEQKMTYRRECYGTEEFNINANICKKCDDYEKCEKKLFDSFIKIKR